MDDKRNKNNLIWIQLKACLIILQLLLGLPEITTPGDSKKDFLREVQPSLHFTQVSAERIVHTGGVKVAKKSPLPLCLFSARQTLPSLCEKTSYCNAAPVLSFLRLNPNIRVRSPPLTFV